MFQKNQEAISKHQKNRFHATALRTQRLKTNITFFATLRLCEKSKTFETAS